MKDWILSRVKELETQQKPKIVMIKVNGKNFRCNCGANCFRELPMAEGSHRYRCQGCDVVYYGN